MKLAKVRHRIIAGLLDNLILIGVAVVLFIGVWPGVIGSIVIRESLTLMMVTKFIRVSIVYAFILLVYYMVIPIFLKGQTIGKKVFKLKLVNDDSTDVDYKVLFFREAICRILVRTVSFGVSTIVSCIIMIIRDDNKTLSDIFAKTKVIDIKEEN